MGRADMVEAASLALHFTYMSGLEEIPEMLRCATERGARTLGVEDEYGIEEGKPADLVVYDAPSALEVMRLHPPRRWVIRRGRVVAETTPARTTLLGEPVTFAPQPDLADTSRGRKHERPLTPRPVCSQPLREPTVVGGST